MNHVIFWILGFATFWIGLKVFDDEAILISAAIVGSVFIVLGLQSAPPALEIAIEVILVVSLFSICMQCIERGGRS